MVQFPHDSTNDHIPEVKAARLRILKEREESRRQEASGGEDSGLGYSGSSEGEDPETNEPPSRTTPKTGLGPSKANPYNDKTKGRREDHSPSSRAKDKQRGKGPLSL